MPLTNMIASTNAPRTVESLRDDLTRLGVRPGDVLEVHCSLSAIGWVCGSAQAVVEALLAAVGPAGTIFMPAHCGINSDPALWRDPPVPEHWHESIRRNTPAFEPGKTPTYGMGAVAELFRSWPGTLRSNHPYGSFCANGPLAECITAQHPLSPMWGMESPLGMLYELNARALLIGVGYSRCTALHLAEAQIPNMPRMVYHAAMLENGARTWKSYVDYDYGYFPFGAFGQTYEDAGGAATGKVGSADSSLCAIRPLVDFTLACMKKHSETLGECP